MNEADRRGLSDAFGRIHEELSRVRRIIECLDKEEYREAHELLDKLEYGAFAPIRKMRLLFNVPYQWKEEAREAEARCGK